MGYYMAGGEVTQEQMAAHRVSRPRAMPSEAEEAEAPGGRPMYRRMNPGNVRALRRSMRRVQAFAKLARKTISFTTRVKMRKHRRK